MISVKRRNRKQRGLIILCVTVVCAALMVGGAFAWTDFSQSRTNKFRGTVDPDVTLHDEFDGEDKDVFVENTGDQDIYVRVRLDEYMEVGGVSFVDQADIKNKATWMPHTYGDNPDLIHDCGNPGEKLFHDYHTWEQTGNQRDYNPGSPGLVYTKLGEDGKVDTTGTKTTAAAAAPVIMKQFTDLNGKEDKTDEEKEIWSRIESGCWILDTDGWAYWSKTLPAGEATNLLLDKVVKTDKEPSDDWFYGIDVKLQAVTGGDFEKWYSNGNEATDSVKEALINFFKRT